ncbi:MAG: hypothetical protein P4L65_06235 [Legionella sp.]|nr:hypothetical protein [Legionella sp.]
MLYSVKGNAKQIFGGFNYPELVEETSSRGIIKKDLFSRTNFLGTEAQAKQYVTLWQQSDLEQHYAQGNMSAGILSCLLARLSFEEELQDQDHKKYVYEHFAYLDDKQQTSGLIVLYRPDEPSQWMIGLIKNPQAAPEAREVLLLSSFDLSVCIENPEFELSVVSTSFANNPLMEQLNSSLIRDLLHHAITDEGVVNSHFSRLRLVLQTIHAARAEGTLKNPINFSELAWSQLFAENRVLDLFVQYNIPLSFTMLKDCLQENSLLVKELLLIGPCEDKKLYENLIRMTLVFYAENTLESNRELLNNRELINKLGGFMWDKTQISLIPFMLSKAYDVQLMQLILSDDVYYNAVNRLVQLGWTASIPVQFDKERLDNEKRSLLTYINQLPDEDSKMLCMIFFLKATTLTLDGYKEIAAMAERYPLMSVALVALDKTGTIINGIDGLRELIANPQEHLKESIKFHFFSKATDKFALKKSDFKKLTIDELDAASKALSLLKMPVTRAREPYEQLLSKEMNALSTALLQLKKGELVANANELQILNEELEAVEKGLLLVQIDPNAANVTLFSGGQRGQLIRNLLPQLAALDEQRVTAAAALEQVESTARNKYRLVLSNEAEGQSLRVFLPQLAILDDVVQRESLIDIFYNNIVHKDINWAEQKHLDKAPRFQEIIIQVERQCALISRLLSAATKPVEAENALQRYRIAIYCIAYDGLMGKTDYLARLKLAEKEILTIIDPPIQSAVYKALFIIAEVLIAALTLGFAHSIKWYQTGNPLFFTHNKAGEQIKMQGRAMLNSVLQLEEEEAFIPPIFEFNPCNGLG